MKINLIEKILGSGFYTGYMKTASGTWASFVGLLIFLIPGFDNPSIMILMISLFILLGVPIADKFESLYGKDPKECTIDEIIGTWITFLFLPKIIWWIFIAFVVWRFMDIIKPFPIRKLEKIKGGWGVILDDVLAGIYSFILIQLIIYFFNLITK